MGTEPKMDLRWDDWALGHEGVLYMVPESSKVQFEPGANVHRFPDRWVSPLTIVNAPRFEAYSPDKGMFTVATRKSRLKLSHEWLQDVSALKGESQAEKYLIDLIVEELKEHNHKYFHSIILARMVDPVNFMPMASVLVRCA